MNRLKARFWHHVGIMYRFVALRSGRTELFWESERALNRAIELDHTLYGAWFNRGLLYWRELGDPARAIADFTEVLAGDPAMADAFFMRGMAYQALGDYHAAALDLATFIEKRPSSKWASNAYSQLMSLYAILEDLPPSLPSGSFKPNS